MLRAFRDEGRERERERKRRRRRKKMTPVGTAAAALTSVSKGGGGPKAGGGGRRRYNNKRNGAGPKPTRPRDNRENGNRPPQQQQQQQKERSQPPPGMTPQRNDERVERGGGSLASGAFDGLGLATPLLRAVATKGYRKPTPIQAKAIPAVLDGRDVMAAAQTGTGKTAGFTLPILQRLSGGRRAQSFQARSLILTPTRELAAQVGESVDLNDSITGTKQSRTKGPPSMISSSFS